MKIRKATETDLEVLREFLSGFDLPLDGVEEHIATMLLGFSEGRLVASAGLEIYGNSALLRSVAVDRDFRNRGYGKALVEASFESAHQKEINYLYLLTDTAEDYFPRFGFNKISREQVPEQVRGSVEFTSACPLSAVVMMKKLES
ncbi:MAG TPA: arsenic resistance N-acetyltransferase ArsN2 [Synergistales bacterium]|nr:arsenic resistance N-acetyltransferase ArsN2 [Synergistales bacterium]